MREGGLVGGEEGVGAMHQPVVSWCVVVGGGEGVVQIVHESHVRGGGLLPVIGGWRCPPGRGAGSCSGRPFGLPMFSRSHSLVLLGVTLGRGWAMLGSR